MDKIKPGKSTTEFVLTLIVGLISGGVGLGIIDPDIIQIGMQHLEQVKEQAPETASTLNAIIDAVYKLVALVTGGYVVGSYTKSRGMAKSANQNVKPENEV